MYIPISISAMDSTQNEIGTVQVIDHSSKFNYIPFSEATQTKENTCFQNFSQTNFVNPIDVYDEALT